MAVSVLSMEFMRETSGRESIWKVAPSLSKGSRGSVREHVALEGRARYARVSNRSRRLARADLADSPESGMRPCIAIRTREMLSDARKPGPYCVSYAVFNP